jgi:hypothetical protein
MVKEYELKAEIDSIANQMHDYDSNPISWMNWIKYLLVKLEDQSKDNDPSHQQQFVEMIAYLKDAIYSRETTGGW